MTSYLVKERNEHQYAYDEWKEEAELMVEYIKSFVKDGKVKWDDVEEVSYEIAEFVSWSADYDDGNGPYDFSDQAKDMLAEVPFNLV